MTWICSVLSSGLPNIRVARRVLLRLVAVFLAGSSLAAFAEEDDAPTPKWAIIATDPSLTPSADLLTARLSQWPNVALVERTEVPRVLAELKLNASGLVQADQAVKFGELAHADALLLLEPVDDKAIPGVPAAAAAGLLRLRLAEVKTGVRLVDAVLPRKDMEAELNQLEAELKRARTKTDIPLDKRRYVGVIPFKSEEAGDALKPLGRTLAVLVATDLQRREQFVVVERDQLQRLTNEKALTGVEMKLRGSSELIEAGLRRDGKGLIISCRINTPGGGDVRKAEVVTETADVPAVLPKLLAALDKALETSPAKVAFDPKIEAALLAKRRDQFGSARRHGEEAELAEVVFALDPAPANLAAVFRAYSSVAHNFQTGGLEAMRRFNELRVEWTGRSAAGSAMRQVVEGYSYNIFDPHVRIPAAIKKIDRESDDESRIRAEADRLNLEYYDTVLKESSNDPIKRRRLLHERIKYAAYLAETGREFSRDFPRLIDEMLAVLQEIKAPLDLYDLMGRGPYPDFVHELFMQINQSVQNCQRNSGGQDQRDWVVEDVIDLWRQLAKHDHPIVRIAGNTALCSRIDAEGKQAALALLELSKEWPAGSQWVDAMRDGAVSNALIRLNRTQEKEEQEFMDGVLSRAAKGDRTEFLRLQFATMTYFYRSPKEAVPERAERLLAVLNPEGLNLEQAQRVRGMRTSVEMYLKNMGGKPPSAPPDFTFVNAPGPWQNFRARPIKLRPPQSPLRGPPNLYAAFVIPDGTKDEEMFLVFGAPYEHFAIERRRLSATASKPFSTLVAGSYDPFQGISFAIGDGTIYIGSSKPHIGVVRETSVEYLDEKWGLPTKRVMELTWFNDRLYVAYPNGFAEYNPEQATFRILASATAVEKKSPFDGHGFNFTTVIPDPETKSLWISGRGEIDGTSTAGLWRYEPAKETWESFAWGGNDMTRWGDTLITFEEVPVPGKLKRARRWKLFDMKEKKPLETRYAPWVHSTQAAFTRIDRYIKFGENLITSDGQMLTPDGQIHRMPLKDREHWLVLNRVGDGFITHYDPPSGTLWFVEPKPQIESKPAAVAPEKK